MLALRKNNFSGVFSDLPEDTLKKLYYEQMKTLHALGALGPDDLAIPINPDIPLWQLIEFQDEIIQFELSCNPRLASKIKQ